MQPLVNGTIGKFRSTSGVVARVVCSAHPCGEKRLSQQVKGREGQQQDSHLGQWELMYCSSQAS